MAKVKSPPWCSATFPLDPHPLSPHLHRTDSLYQAISLYLRARSVRVQGHSVLPASASPSHCKCPPSLGYQDSKWVFPGTGSVSPRDAIPHFAPHFTQRRLRTRLSPHFCSDPGFGLLRTLEQALGPGHVPAGPPQVLGRCHFSAGGETALPLQLSSSGTVPPGLKSQNHLRISSPLHLLVNFQMSTHPCLFPSLKTTLLCGPS